MEARTAVLDAVGDLPLSEATRLLSDIAHNLRPGQVPTGPNAVLPCGTDSARRRHLAHGQICTVCGVTP